jgi:hypothetical protein
VRRGVDQDGRGNSLFEHISDMRRPACSDENTQALKIEDIFITAPKHKTE